MEGGGDSNNGRAALRRGMDAFLAELKQAARNRRWGWKLACVGSRDNAFRAFRNATERCDGGVVILLVDAEDPVREAPRPHLHRRDGWELGFAQERSVHLMVQTMEAWIVADGDKLAAYYGQGFRKTALPGTPNLESVSKQTIERALEIATQATTKGRYQKIRHASQLLERVRPERVRERCAACGRLLDFLREVLG
jgi:hypothetical protein